MKVPKLQPFLKRSSGSKSVLAGAPADFDFLATLRHATSIRVAMAFGHMTGWQRIETAVLHSAARDIFILLGQAFFQTEPELLALLLARKRESASLRIHVKLSSSASTFHPKVWIIENRRAEHAHVIVGSANLSNGGLESNIECSAYLDSPSAATGMRDWFDALWNASPALTRERLDAYRKGYENSLQLRKQLRASVDAAALDLEYLEQSWRREEAIKEARRYFLSPKGIAAAKRRVSAMKAIRKCLKPRSFDFGQPEWNQFLEIHEFGSMKRIRRDTAERLPAIRRAFVHLADASIPLVQRVDDVIRRDGRFHVHGMGRNIVTKVLAMLEPQKRPVYNEAVGQALKSFGYRIDQRKSPGEQYDDYCREMTDFVLACGRKEMLSIDAFFEYYFHGKIKKIADR